MKKAVIGMMVLTAAAMASGCHNDIATRAAAAGHYDTYVKFVMPEAKIGVMAATNEAAADAIGLDESSRMTPASGEQSLAIHKELADFLLQLSGTEQ